MGLHPGAAEAARAWIDDDPDPVTGAELRGILDAAEAGDPAAAADLEDRFAGMLSFGTAGLRGAIGAGPNRMNVAVVIRTAAGLAAWVKEEHEAGGAPPSVVVGFDARLRSSDFAAATAEVLAAAGVRARVLPGPLPTPVLAFAVRELGASAGVMVTASHNPPGDNGYKVYDGSGSQIVSPVDSRIAAVIGSIDRVSAVPRAEPNDPHIDHLEPVIVDGYVERAARVGLVPSARDLRAAYTAMHGVGAETFRRVFAAAGFPDSIEVAEQVEPDPRFPTVDFPNPEEPGALDLGIAAAAAAGASILLANDPDADRLGAAVPDPALGAATDPSGWRILRGDEIGAILADHILRHDPAVGGASVPATFATTIVSSTLLSEMAHGGGVGFRETLTGFKWIARAAEDLRFGYEEALGFAVAPDLVADKDGITAAVLLAEAAAVARGEGRTVLDTLDDLARRHGMHRTAQRSVRIDGTDGPAAIAAAMRRLREDPPADLAGVAVRRIDDLLMDGGDLPRSDVVVIHLDGARVVVRPSGTEPKLKCYLEVVESVADEDGSTGPEALSAAAARCEATLRRLGDAALGVLGLTD